MESGKISRLSDKQKNYWEEEETYLVCRTANSYHDSQSFWLSLNYKTLKYSLKEMEHIRDSSLGRVLVVVVVVLVVVVVVVGHGKSESSDVMPSQTLTVVKVGPQWGCWGGLCCCEWRRKLSELVRHWCSPPVSLLNRDPPLRRVAAAHGPWPSTSLTSPTPSKKQTNSYPH